MPFSKGIRSCFIVKWLSAISVWPSSQPCREQHKVMIWIKKHRHTGRNRKCAHIKRVCFSIAVSEPSVGSEETVPQVLRVHVQIPSQNHQICSTGRVAKEAARCEFIKSMWPLFSMTHLENTLSLTAQTAAVPRTALFCGVGIRLEPWSTLHVTERKTVSLPKPHRLQFLINKSEWTWRTHLKTY